MFGFDDYESYDDYGSDNPVATEEYDWFPDPSLGGEQEALGQSILQESLGRSIIAETQAGMEQEALGQNILDRLLSSPDNTQPWYAGVDGSLNGVAKAMKSLGVAAQALGSTPTDGGVPVSVGPQHTFSTKPTNQAYSIFPTNTTRDGRTGTMGGGILNGFFGPIRPTATVAGKAEVSGTDILYIAGTVLVGYIGWRAWKAA